MYRHVIPKGNLHNQHKAQVVADLMKLEDNRAHLVQFSLYRKKRSNEQNAFLHAVPLRIIADHTGYDVDDIKTYLLGEAFGWDEFELFGERRRRPVRRSSELNTSQFSFFMEFIEQWASQELYLTIPKPNEYLLESE